MSTFTEVTDWYQRYGEIYLTTKPLHWEIGRKGSGLWVTVPKDFPFDVTVPRGLRWLVDRHNPIYLKASALHDYALYRSKWDRVTAGAAFAEGLRATKVAWFKRLLLVLIVVAFRFD